MSFLVAAALALGVFVVAPVAAHLLRRGRAEEQEFPPAHLVPVAYRSARKKSRLEDRLLLLMRALLVFALAIVGAVPFVRCSRLALDRDAGASVALALVIDDSLSMRTRIADADTRWDVALKGARDLLKSTREGDAVGIVLAGEPSRLALAATTDLGVVRQTLDRLKPTDRSTDLRSAIRLAESSLKALPHVDKRIAVLSDFAGDPGKLPERALWIPLPELRQASQNCGIAQARKEGLRVVVNVACTGSPAGVSRTLRVVAGAGPAPNPKGAELAKVALKPQAGSQRIELELSGAADSVDAFLSAGDALEQDDYAAVAEVKGAMLIGVVADPATAAAQEGTATVLEQALNALTATSTDVGPAGEIRPLPLIPEDEKELSHYSAFIIDDPPGLAPESRTALTAWMTSEAGFAAAFLGPNVEAAQLGASFEPFAHGALTWETTSATSIVDPSGLLGDAGASLKNIAPRGRLLLAGALIPDSETMLAWDDQSPW
ncbi:MAG TPA: VWA domain-containing protein, partial [Polyangiaceae bacterium]|nr:VWA domain-containing protein [Polyangiaceae bacterium]